MSCCSTLYRLFRPLVVLATALVCFACGASAKVHVTKNLDAKAASYDSVNVAATGSPAEVARAARKFEEILSKRLKSAGVFKSVEPDGQLVISCKVTHMEFGDEDTRELSLRQKAQVTIEIRITKPDGTLLGHVTATATARKKNADDQPAVRVLEMAADEVVEYLVERTGRGTVPGTEKGKAKAKTEAAGKAPGSEAGGGEETAEEAPEEPVGISAEEATRPADEGESDAESAGAAGDKAAAKAKGTGTKAKAAGADEE